MTEEFETSFYRASAAADPPAQKDTEINMNTRQNVKSGSSIEQQFSSISMSGRIRSAALHDAHIGELFADAVVWVCNKMERPSAGVFAKASPKY